MVTSSERSLPDSVDGSKQRRAKAPCTDGSWARPRDHLVWLHIASCPRWSCAGNSSRSWKHLLDWFLLRNHQSELTSSNGFEPDWSFSYSCHLSWCHQHSVYRETRTAYLGSLILHSSFVVASWPRLAKHLRLVNPKGGFWCSGNYFVIPLCLWLIIDYNFHNN